MTCPTLTVPVRAKSAAVPSAHRGTETAAIGALLELPGQNSDLHLALETPLTLDRDLVRALPGSGASGVGGAATGAAVA
jgi:hypothetical protein